MIQKFIGAAAVVYAIVSTVYGNADAANVGFAEIDKDWLVYGLPAVAGVAYPLLGSLVDKVKGINLPSLSNKEGLTAQLKEVEACAKAATDALNKLYETMDRAKEAK